MTADAPSTHADLGSATRAELYARATDRKAAGRPGMTKVAQARALSDEIGRIERDIEPEILRALHPAALLVDDVVHLAVEAAGRVRSDHGGRCSGDLRRTARRPG